MRSSMEWFLWNDRYSEPKKLKEKPSLPKLSGLLELGPVVIQRGICW